MDVGFTQDDIRDFLMERGGRAKNHELVTHFKKYLNNPETKATAREAFKDFVNTIATVKQNQDGEKIMVLKKQYRVPSTPRPACDDTGSSLESAVLAALVRTDANQSRTTAAAPKEEEVCVREEASEREEHALPPYVPPPVYTPEERETPGYRAPPVYASPPELNPTKLDFVEEATPKRHMKESGEAEEAEPSRSEEDAKSVDTMSLASTTSSTSRESSQPPMHESFTRVAMTDSDSSRGSPSVKDRAHHLNKIEKAQPEVPVQKRETKTKPEAEEEDAEGSEGYVNVTLDEEEKMWMLASTAADYAMLSKMLGDNPELVRFRDFMSGYTALHHASRRGRCEVVKLLAGKYGGDVNQRTFGGYTPVHLAAIQGHNDCLELLLNTYKADPHMRDYSGKMATHYLRNKGALASLYANQERNYKSHADLAKINPNFIRKGSFNTKMRKVTEVIIPGTVGKAWGSADDIVEVSGHGDPSDSQLMPPPSNRKKPRKTSHRNLNEI
ncbi:PREDICTED: ankyrin repeat domain-containing protein SOWAHA-like isoform X3 [Priapulus caudatus]|uniref:Ankyrin repeat domain-containing protein SOWAHA-like isoform X3 n=1 Tax=Priapulus caudatus TaxID=37621 RepID=A0ABM1F792_PRICU|nr:PREDICTED: ankyrin repeat domain-containing protein SOWAHA-like isoform X3 [Priapulus caudatus]